MSANIMGDTTKNRIKEFKIIQEFDLIVIRAGTGGNGVARATAAANWKGASVDNLRMEALAHCAAVTPKRC